MPETATASRYAASAPRGRERFSVMVRLDEDQLRCLDLVALEMGGASRAQVLRAALVVLARQYRVGLSHLSDTHGAARPVSEQDMLSTAQVLVGPQHRKQ